MSLGCGHPVMLMRSHRRSATLGDVYGDMVRPRREEPVQLPRRDRTRAKAAMEVVMPIAAKQ
eukprot:4155686-Prymnesium_polylepis.1